MEGKEQALQRETKNHEAQIAKFASEVDKHEAQIAKAMQKSNQDLEKAHEVRPL